MDRKYMTDQPENKQNQSHLNEPALEYVIQHNSKVIVPDCIIQDIQISLDQADQGLLIPYQQILARYQ